MNLTKTVKQRILEILLDGQPHHGSEFLAITHRYSCPIERLRKEDGYKIKTLYLDGRNKMAWYQLVSMLVAA